MARLVVLKQNTLIQIVPLTRNPCLIGRKSGNSLTLSHPSVSRQHAKVFFGEGGYQIVDLGSTNGILVNSNKVVKSALKDGDQVTLGDFTLIFNGEEAADEGGGLRPPDSLRSSTLLLQDTVTQSFSPGDELSAFKDSYDVLRALFLLVQRFQNCPDVNRLVTEMMDCLMDIFRAERGAILLYTSKTGRFELAIQRGSASSEEDLKAIHLIALKVAKERKPLLITDVELEGLKAEWKSPEGKPVRSLICAPLIQKQRTLGVVYMDSPLSQKVFTSRDIGFLEAFCQHTVTILMNALEKDELAKESRNLKALAQGAPGTETALGSVVGESRKIREVLGMAERVAREDVTVLIMGETGTGKELLAKAVHMESPRRDKPFVAVNVMALSGDILESELFGHEKGAFSGALERRIGRFEYADGGTLFLDEVAELSPSAQVKLLRVLQERQIERVGGNQGIPVDVRIVCATNGDLKALVHQGRFREDLYYRIHVFPLHLPALKERRDDIPLLCDHFLTRFNQRMTRKHSGFTPEALDRLGLYDWPGNVRELINVLERAFVLEPNDLIGERHLYLEMDPSRPAPPVSEPDPVIARGPETVPPLASPDRIFDRALYNFERQFMIDALKRSRGNISQVAQETGIPRRTVYRKLEDLGIDPKSYI